MESVIEEVMKLYAHYKPYSQAQRIISRRTRHYFPLTDQARKEANDNLRREAGDSWITYQINPLSLFDRYP